ncbi:MAG: alpha/beta hydrolase [Ignavibacteriales bacterium]|nr:alpha/beta hydrolase [Ignavibacteriales bacterium]
MSFLLAILILIVLFLISAALVVLVIGPLILLQPQRRKKEWYARFTTQLEPKDAKLSQEDVVIVCRDGIRLHGWLVAQPKRRSRGTVLYLHGVGDCKTGGIALTKFLYRLGYNIFLYDSRAHGESEGKYCTYGYYEKDDVSTVIDYLMRRRDLRVGSVGVFGTSMGAAVAIQAAMIDDRIQGVIAEACFTDLRTISVDYQRRIIKLPWHFLRNVAMSRSQKIARFKARDVSPLKAVQRLRTPILFIHGTLDSFIRHEYSQSLFTVANDPKQFLSIEGANHNDVWDVGGKRYENAVAVFFKKYLK